jgi:hypothetical protein
MFGVKEEKMRFAKVIILIFVFSSDLMLGQKTEIPKVKRCAENQTAELRIVQTQPTIAEKIIENCSESEITTGAFFQFAAF